jgi:branched-chain amino acid transport system permease protein
MKRLGTVVWLGFLGTLPLWMTDPYALHILINVGIFAIAAMSLNLLLGYTGQLSLGHVVFFGIGAYCSALVSLGFDVEIPLGSGSYTLVFGARSVTLAFLSGIVMAGFFGWLIGKLSFKVRGAYFVIVTISFAEVVKLVALNWVDLTEGPMALNNIPPFSFVLPGFGEVAFYRKLPNYYLVVSVCVLSYVVVRRVVHSRIGRALVALRENESLAESVGINVRGFLVLAAVVSAALAGAAGGIYAHYIKIVDPDIFLFIYTVSMVIMVVTGGKGTLAGPIVGALIFGILPELLREVAGPEVQWILYGVIMILIVYFLPDGIVPAVTSWWEGRFAVAGPIAPVFGVRDPELADAESRTPSAPFEK